LFIELIDLLRCPNEHADSWMVAAFKRMDGRFVIDATLGCPICSASYSITNGVADLRAAHEEVAGPPQQQLDMQPVDADALRAAALLGLTRPGSLVVLTGEASRFSEAIRDMTEARVIAINPAFSVPDTERTAVVLADAGIPLAPLSVDAIMVDSRTASLFASDSARVLRQGGRLVAPADTKLDPRMRELARDASELVAESAGQLIKLSR
jgi:hypothetical protein